MEAIPISSYLREKLSKMLHLVDDLPEILFDFTPEQARDLEEEQPGKRSRDQAVVHREPKMSPR